MLGKLAFRNVMRSSKDYLIYFITITTLFSLMFALNLVSWSDEVVFLSENMDTFKSTIVFVNVIVVVVISFLINYTTRFMFEKRSKEFGMYLLLGIPKKKVSRMFLLENVLFGFVALILAIPIGFVFSQFISLFIVQVLELPQIIFIKFHVMAFLLLFIYFVFIYIIVLFLAYRRMKRINIYQLLYLEKQNEEKVIRKGKHRMLLFVFSLLLGFFAFLVWNSQFQLDLVQDSSVLTYLIFGLCLFIFSIYGVMFSVSDFFLSLVLRKKEIKYRKDYLFLVRTYASKARTMGFTMGTLGVLILFTFLFLNFSSLNKGLYDSIIETTAPFDVSVHLENREYLEDVLAVVSEDYTISSYVMYDIYLDTNSNIEKLLPAYSYKSEPYDRLMKVSDYNRLLEMKGKEPTSLDNDEYLLVVETAGMEFVKDSSIKTILLSNGVELHQKDITTEMFFYGLSNESYVVVVPDEALKGLDVFETFLSIDTREETTSALEEKLEIELRDVLCGFMEDGTSHCENYRITVQGTTVEESNVMTALVTSICVYMAFIFAAIVGTILAIQSLSDSAKYRYRYTVLKRLGVRDEVLYKTIRKQLYILFGVPVIYPFIISFGTVYLLNQIYQTLLPSPTAYLGYFFLSTVIFLVIYVIYFLATYFGFKRNINQN
ncbi:TPA: ABC transporter permease [Candidatus Ventrenecus avicola]|nr:ABC transporter permease [Candidatus Ventrenecus avicola]